MGYIFATATVLATIAALINYVDHVDAKEATREKRCAKKNPSGPEIPQRQSKHVQKYNENWPSQCIMGKRQSPINLSRSNAKQRNEKISFYKYDEDYFANMANSGHSVQLTFKEHLGDASSPYITYSLFGEAQYDLSNLHFHWDAEHTFDGYRYPLEAHLVHYNNKYSDLNEAINHNHAVMVLAVMYNVQNRCPSGNNRGKNGFNSITKNINKISKRYHIPYMIPNKITITDFLPSNIYSYYTYDGSLTTPSCTEGVQWIVFDTPSCIEKTQLKSLTDVYTETKEKMYANYRYLQELNGRDIFYVSIAEGKSHTNSSD